MSEFLRPAAARALRVADVDGAAPATGPASSGVGAPTERRVLVSLIDNNSCARPAPQPKLSQY